MNIRVQTRLVTLLLVFFLAPFSGWAKEIKGKITAISNKAKVIQILVKDESRAIPFSKNTKFVNAKSSRDLIINDVILVEITAGQRASKIVRKVVKVPKGQLVTLKQMRKMVAQPDRVTIVDARPGKRYLESHIPGAISIPWGKLKKDDSLLPKNKKKLLVFYCGGPT